MKKDDFVYFFVICYGFVNLVPVFSAFKSEFQYTTSFGLPLFCSYIGMMFVGLFIEKYLTITRKTVAVAWFALFAIVIVECIVTALVFANSDGEGFLVLDNRELTPIVATSAALFVLGKYYLQIARHMTFDGNGRIEKIIGLIAANSFGIYLVHPFFLSIFGNQYWTYMATAPKLLVTFGYQLGVFTCSLVVVWLLRKIPIVRQTL